METKQINIAVPFNLYIKLEDYVEKYGYRNAQDLFLDLIRQRVVFDNLDNFPLKDDFINDVLNISEKDFLGVKDSEKIHKELMKKL